MHEERYDDDDRDHNSVNDDGERVHCRETVERTARRASTIVSVSRTCTIPS